MTPDQRDAMEVLSEVGAISESMRAVLEILLDAGRRLSVDEIVGRRWSEREDLEEMRLHLRGSVAVPLETLRARGLARELSEVRGGERAWSAIPDGLLSLASERRRDHPCAVDAGPGFVAVHEGCAVKIRRGGGKVRRSSVARRGLCPWCLEPVG